MRQELSDRYLSSLKKKVEKNPPTKDFDIFETDGFGVRIRRSGTVSYFYKYRYEGKLRFMTLGTYPSVGLSAARKLHRTHRDARKNGLDPMVEKEKAKEKQKATEWEAKTVKDFCEDFIGEAKETIKTWRKYELTLNGDVVRAWGKRRVIDIADTDAVDLLKEIKKRGAPGQAQNVLECARRMWNWAIEDKKRLKYNPFAGISRQTPHAPGGAALEIKEIKQWWDAVSTCQGMTEEISRALKLTLLTAQRAGEVIALQYEEISCETGEDGLEHRWWTIPAGKNKSQTTDHRVYITESAWSMINHKEGLAGYVFPCPDRTKNQPISEGAMGSALRRAYAAGIISGTKITPHDLRRTAVTHMSRIGIEDDQWEKVVNHLPKKLRRVYNKYKYDRIKIHVALTWEKELLRLVGGGINMHD